MKKKNSQVLAISTILALICFVIAVAYGWVCNIIILYGTSFTPLTGETVLRCLGVVLPPLGAVMGYL